MNRDIIQKYQDKLSKSNFRQRFHLMEKDKLYIYEKGLNTILDHAKNIINERLAPANIPNDGHQTPMRNHPVFIAQHATATCCRQCLYKWYHIPPHKQLSNNEVNFIIAMLMSWIIKELKSSK